MENNNGKGIFYGVIGIATLIVAIIGATFAYFTATASSGNRAINVTSYQGFNVSLVMSKIAPTSAVNKLIPLNSSTYMTNALTHKDSSGNSQPCIDVNGDQVCAIYQMTLTNSGPAAEIQGYLTAETNEYTTSNLKYQIYNCTTSASGSVIDTFTPIEGSTAQSAPTVGADSAKFVFGSGNNQTISMAAGDTTAQQATYCLVMWLEDTGTAQNADIGKSFAGKVTFNAASGSSGKLQATFN